VRSLDPKPDIILLTGDVAATGSGSEYQYVAAQLRSFACPVLAIPGNHDKRDAMYAGLPAHTNALPGGHLCILFETPSIRFIGLDTLVPDRVHGELCAERLAWFEATLAADRNKPAFVFMHHPPFETGLTAMDRVGLREGREAFVEILSRFPNIICVACGHAHRPISASAHGIPVRLAPSAAYPFALDLRPGADFQYVLEPPQIALHLWREDTGLVSHLSYIDAFPGPFPLR
jgi:Icc protein